MIVSSDRVLSNRPFNDAPIGIFDSGFGGLTVAREIAQELPEESIVYFGDTARCPYGPRSQSEVDGFVQQICTWLVGRDVKLLVIACNTATAAGLEHAQQRFSVPGCDRRRYSWRSRRRACDEKPPRGRHRHEGHG